MRKRRIILFAIAGLIVLGIGLYWLPPINQRLSWRIDFAMTYLRGVFNPAGPVPTPIQDSEVTMILSSTPVSTATKTALPDLEPTPSPTEGPTETPVPTPTPLPESVFLPAPTWVKQDINNCGPAALAMYLRFYGWAGDQFDIAYLLKPQREDRNVNVEELIYYVRTQAGWLNAEYRVGGDLELLKKLIAAGIPVMIEESFYFEAPYWPNDDLWAAHYNLITGYDQASQTFVGQDSYHGPDQKIPEKILDEYWQAFNRVYILTYLPDQEDTVKTILEEDWDPNTNRAHALEVSLTETQTDPQNPFSWFNLGTNLAYFERYQEASEAYDVARNLGLPQRMLRYQFGPFLAYFHSGRVDDLMTLTEYALQRTPNAEEAYLWRGWGNYRLGNTNQAMADFRQALLENPNYLDAQYAQNYLRDNR